MGWYSFREANIILGSISQCHVHFLVVVCLKFNMSINCLERKILNVMFIEKQDLINRIKLMFSKTTL